MKRFDRYIGIDAGANGAIAHISEGDFAKTVSMPDSVEALYEYLKYLKETSENPLACLEKVNVWREDANRGKTFGIEKLKKSYNEITMALKLIKIPFIPVPPVTWQSYLHLAVRGEEYTERKRRFKLVAQAQFPQVKVTLTNADALLIMKFIALKNMREPDWIERKLPESIVKTLEL